MPIANPSDALFETVSAKLLSSFCSSPFHTLFPTPPIAPTIPVTAPVTTPATSTTAPTILKSIDVIEGIIPNTLERVSNIVPIVASVELTFPSVLDTISSKNVKLDSLVNSEALLSLELFLTPITPLLREVNVNADAVNNFSVKPVEESNVLGLMEAVVSFHVDATVLPRS